MFFLSENRKPLLLVMVLVLLQTGFGISASWGQCVVIDSTNTTESRCLNSGTVTISATGMASPFTYRLISGPAGYTLPPLQSSNVFGGLMPGMYTFMVTDDDGCSDTAGFTITGTYQSVNPSAIATAPTCSSGDNGYFTISANGNRPPYVYQLLSPLSRSPQSSNIIDSLPSGTYTYSVTDSCGNFQTRSVIVPGGLSNEFSVGTCVRHIGCDSFTVRLEASPAWGSVHKYPYTIRYYTNPADTHTLTVSSGVPSAEFLVAGASDSFYYEFENNCGFTRPWTGRSADDYTDLYNSLSPLPATCGTYNYRYNMNSTISLPSAYASATCSGIPDSLHYYLLGPLGDTLLSRDNDPLFTGLAVGSGYKVVATGTCFYRERIFNVTSPPAPTVTAFVAGVSCKVGGAIVYMAVNSKQAPTKLILTSGPSSIVFQDTTINLSYPDTLFNDFGYGYTGHWGVGTYTVKISDTCLNEATTTFTVTGAQVRQAIGFAATPLPGCIGNSSIAYTYTNPGGNVALRLSPHVPASGFPAGGLGLGASGADTVRLLSEGPYRLLLQYTDGATYTYLNKFTGIPCDVDTIALTLTTATNPLFDYPAMAVCPGGVRNISVIVDSSHGVAPYTFELKPSASMSFGPVQSSPVFTGLTAGVYDVRIGDACGNSFTKSLFIDTLAVPGIRSLGTTFCIGDSIRLVVPVNQYYTYIWTMPDGSTYTGDTLDLGTTVAGDFGMYRVKVISEIGACVDSSIRFFTLVDCMPLPVELIDFKAVAKWPQHIRIEWTVGKMYSQTEYRLLHSTDGKSWEEIHTQAAGMEQSENTRSYHYLHYGVLEGTHMYKLKILDRKSSSLSYSPVQTVYWNRATRNGNILVSPNPSKGRFSVTTDIRDDAWLRIYDLQGRLVTEQYLDLNSGVPEVDLHTAKGTYLLQIQDRSGNTYRERIQVE